MDQTLLVTNVLGSGAENFAIEEQTCMMRGFKNGHL